MHLVFAYGTLCDPVVRNQVLGRPIEAFTAGVTAFIMHSIELEGIRYPLVIEDPKAIEIIQGEFFEVKEEELARLDEYESEAYLRKLTKMDNGKMAWIYYQANEVLN